MWLTTLATALALSAPPPDAGPATARAQLNFSASVGGTLLVPALPAPDSAQIVTGSGGLSAHIFLRPVLQDEAPLSLQPFLQRVSTLSLSAGSSGFSSTFVQPWSRESVRRVIGGWASADGLVYLTPSFLLSAGLGFTYVHVSDTQTPAWRGSPSSTVSAYRMYLPVGVGLGARFGDVLLQLAYSIEPLSVQGGPWSVPFWGGASASVRAVLWRETDLSVRVSVIKGGAAASSSITSYQTRNLGLFASVFYAHGILYSDETRPQNRAGGDLGGLCWFSDRMGAQLSFGVTWTSGPAQNTRATVGLEGSLSAFTRL
jgi:hypothetical protein